MAAVNFGMRGTLVSLRQKFTEAKTPPHFATFISM